MKTRVTNYGYTSGNHREKRRYRAVEQQIQLYNEALRLRQKERLTCKQITERIHDVYGERLSPGHVGNWLRGYQTPLGRINKFDATPTPELAEIIAAKLSDGTQYEDSNYRYTIKLAVKDREFAETFGHDLAKVLGRNEPYEPRWSRSDEKWVVKGYSVLLYRFLDTLWHELRPFIEHCRHCVAAFLRIFFDAEGSITRKQLTVHNTNRELLVYIQHLLRCFNIEATGPHDDDRRGKSHINRRTGATYVRKKTYHFLYIRRRCLPRYHKYIGFQIKRKQLRLIEAIQE